MSSRGKASSKGGGTAKTKRIADKFGEYEDLAEESLQEGDGVALAREFQPDRPYGKSLTRAAPSLKIKISYATRG